MFLTKIYNVSLFKFKFKVLSKHFLTDLKIYFSNSYTNDGVAVKLYFSNNYQCNYTKTMGPLQVSDHMVQKPPYWNANCPLGHLKRGKII